MLSCPEQLNETAISSWAPISQIEAKTSFSSSFVNQAEPIDSKQYYVWKTKCILSGPVWNLSQIKTAIISYYSLKKVV